MFAACPHCQFLVAQHPQTRALPPACPRCGQPIAGDRADAASPTPSLATYLHPAARSQDAKERSEASAASSPALEIRPDANDDALPAAVVAQTREPDAGGSQATAVGDVASEATTTRETPTAAQHESGAADDDEVVPPPQANGGVAPHTSSDILRDATPDSAPGHAPSQTVPAAPSASVSTTAATARTRSTATPRFTRVPRTTPVHARIARWQWASLVGLALLLCVQVVLADRHRLAMSAAWRPLVTTLCGVFACDVPTWREPSALAMLSRDVRPVPGAPGTLQAQATFRNDARWTQAWPVILLTLKDADGRTLGARALQPRDYLGDAATQEGLAPGQSAQVAVHVREPSASVVAFSFDFR